MDLDRLSDRKVGKELIEKHQEKYPDAKFVVTGGSREQHNIDNFMYCHSDYVNHVNIFWANFVLDVKQLNKRVNTASPLSLNPIDAVLAECIVNGLIVTLPNKQLDKKLYSDVKLKLEKIGGKWNTKAQGFKFEHNPEELLGRVVAGEKVNLKKDFQFFATPSEIVDEMIKKAALKKTDVVLEPSAGRGAIVDKIIKLVKKVEMCEFMKQNRDYLEQDKGYELAGEDFLALNTKLKYDKIIANPPFTKNQDVIHVLKMYEHLKPGGRIVAIMSTSWMTGKQRKQQEFKEFLASLRAEAQEIEAGAFKDSGTGVPTVMVIIDKP